MTLSGRRALPKAGFTTIYIDEAGLEKNINTLMENFWRGIEKQRK